MEAEELRRQYLPNNVRVLMVGESPPVGGTFFYAANSNLFRYTKVAFEKALGRTWSSDEAFLQFFSREGFFLDDLCLHPVSGLPNAERRRSRKAGIGPLSERLAEYKPESLVVTPKAILSDVMAAIRQSGNGIRPLALPFPAMSWQQAYVDGLIVFLKDRYR